MAYIPAVEDNNNQAQVEADGAEEIKVVTMLHTTEVKLECPYCGNEERGFIGSPRGGEFQCDNDECGKTYKVHPDADVDFPY